MDARREVVGGMSVKDAAFARGASKHPVEVLVACRLEHRLLGVAEAVCGKSMRGFSATFGVYRLVYKHIVPERLKRVAFLSSGAESLMLASSSSACLCFFRQRSERA